MGDPRQVSNQPFDKAPPNARASFHANRTGSTAPRSSPAFSPGATLTTLFAILAPPGSTVGVHTSYLTKYQIAAVNFIIQQIGE
jgi:hypothetical protein